MNFLSAAARKIRTSAGVLLSFGSISDGHTLVRSGTAIVGSAGAAPGGSAGGDLSGTYPNPTVARVAGTTPGAGGLAVLDDASVEAVRATISAARTWQKTAAPTVNDDSDDGYVAGDFWNDTTNNRTYVADSVAVGAADWRSLLTPTGLRGYITGGVPYMVATAFVNGAIIDVGAAVTATATADPSSFASTMSGTNLTVAIGTNVATALQTGGQYWTWTFASLNVTPPSGVFRARTQVKVSSFTDGTRAGIQHVLLGLGTGPTVLSKALGFSRASGSAFGFSGNNTSGTPFNATGAATTVEVRGTQLCKTTASVGHAAERYGASSAIEGVNDLTAGIGLAGTPTHVTLYTYLQTASSASDWVLNDLTWSVAWSGL